MPTPKLEFCILLSSPSDINEERQAASEIIHELSLSLAESYPIVLRLLSWEGNVAPGFGTEAQQVINTKLGDAWDIYLGMMHARFGSPTAGFGSGTEEEFERAYALWNENRSDRELMLYFKTGPVDIEDIDAEQLSKVKAFKSRASSLGGLYKSFTNVENFRDLLRAHLTSVIVALYKRHQDKSNISFFASGEPVNPQPFIEEGNLLGILDYVESASTGMEQLKSTIEAIGNDMSQSRIEVDSYSRMMQEASSNQDLQGMRRSTSGLSKSLLDLAKSLAERRRAYNAISRSSFDALSTAVSLAKSSSNAQIDISMLASNVSEAIAIAGEFVATLRSIDRSMNQLPNLAKEFNAARMLLKREFRDLATEVDSSVALLKNLLDVIEN